jgi:hypothetical protein
MRRISFLFLILSCTTTLAQVEHDSTSIIYAWKLNDIYTKTEEIAIDTSLTDFQVYNPIYQHSVSNSFLSNLGSPGMSNVFTERYFDYDRYFLNSYYPYFQTIENTSFYNSKKPYSRLTYTYGPPQALKEESFEAFHTQNITPKLNFGFRYHNISSRGQYNYLQVKKNSFRLFSSYTGDRYTLHTAFNLNRYKASENGGIIDSVFELKDYAHIKLIETRLSGSGPSEFLSDAENRVRCYDLLISQRLKLFTLASKADTSDTTKARNIAEPILSYVFKMDRASKTYVDDNPLGSGFYDSLYFNTKGTLDSMANFRINNSVQLEFKTTFRRKVQMGLYGMIGNEYEKFSNYSLWDTGFTQSVDTFLNPFVKANSDTLKGASIDTVFNSTYLSAGIYGNFWKRVWTDFSGTYWLAGYKQNQFRLEGIIKTRLTLFKNDFEFDITGLFENKIPGYLLEHYYSNHYIWNMEMKPENSYRLSSVIRNPSKNFELKGNYSVLRNFIYFNQDALPENYNQILNYFSVEATQVFKIWNLYSKNRVIYQVSENQNVLPLPSLILYNSTYVDYTFRFKSTNGELRTILGVDIYYNTMFNGYEYLPETSQFYVQNLKEIGNYPLMNVFLNIKLKRVRFYAQIQHLNSSWLEQRYYSAIHYPYNQGLDIDIQNAKIHLIAWKFGLSWSFYD